jgi:hypothetical protein
MCTFTKKVHLQEEATTIILRVPFLSKYDFTKVQRYETLGQGALTRV